MSVRTFARPVISALVGAALASAVCVTAAARGNSQPDTAPAASPRDSAWPRDLVDSAPDLVRPQSLTIDRSIPLERARLEVRLAQQLYTFWNTGETKYLDAAVSPSFRDNTLPAGRPQGPTGPVFASKNFRTAVPDLTCELADVLVTGDKITARLVFRGHFTGTFNGTRGKGQSIEFNAFDIQQVGTDQIVADWHLEDNATLMTQLGMNGSN